MWPFKKKLSLKQQIIDIGFNQLSVRGCLPFEIEDFDITIWYNTNSGCVEIKVARDDKWNKEILFTGLTKLTFDIFKISMIRCVDNLISRSD